MLNTEGAGKGCTAQRVEDLEAFCDLGRKADKYGECFLLEMLLLLLSIINTVNK